MFAPFIPHGHCYLWRTDLVLLHSISDALISLAYFSIPSLLIYFVRQRQDVPFRPIFILFSAFIICCGLTHVFEIWTLWMPAYWISGGMKVITAVVSLYTAFRLIPILPEAVAMPSPSELAMLNQTLSNEIQERKQAEEQIYHLNQKLQKQVQDLEQVAILKDEFLSTVSHELRTPLTSMKMALTMLKLNRDPHKQDSYLGILESEWQRELKLVNQLLELQSLSAGNKLCCAEEVNLTARIKDLVAPFWIRCENRDQTLTLQFSRDPLLLKTDPTLLDQVFLELLNNACKYTPPGHRIEVMCAALTNGCEITITNTGVTIPEADQPYIFDKFYRNATLDHFNQGGTGLGLAIVRKSVELLQGEIGLTSQDNMTCVKLTLPHLT